MPALTDNELPLKYLRWIDVHVDLAAKLQCREVSEAMANAFPELTRVCGHYVAPIDGMRPHWWLIDADKRVIDPTRHQFQSEGAGEYVQLEKPPIARCQNCGEPFFDDASYPFCCDACADETVDSLNEIIQGYEA